MTQKWPGGLLTNFAVMKKNLDRIKESEEKTKDGWTKLPPIPGYKAPAEKSEPPAPKPKPKPKKTKTESKPSDFLEKI